MRGREEMKGRKTENNSRFGDPSMIPVQCALRVAFLFAVKELGILGEEEKKSHVKIK